MARTTLLLLIIVSPIWLSMVTSLAQKHRRHRKHFRNPYHPEDTKFSELLDFSAENSEYFAEKYGRLSEERTTMADKNLKVNGKRYTLGKTYEDMDYFEISQMKKQ